MSKNAFVMEKQTIAAVNVAKRAKISAKLCEKS